MKKSILPGILSLFLVAGFILMVSMAPPPPNKVDCKSSCQYLVSVGIFSKTGACMSACNVCTNKAEPPAQIANCYCKIIDDTEGGVQSAGFKNFGDCITTLKKE